MSCGFLCFHLCGSGVPVTTTCHCCAVVFLQSRRMRRSLHTLRCVRPLRLMAQSTFRRHPCGLFPAVDFPGAGVTTSRFSSPGEDIPSTKFLAINPAKNFASAPGQLPRDVVTDAPSERSTAGRNPEEVDGRRGFRPSGEQPVGPAT